MRRITDMVRRREAREGSKRAPSCATPRRWRRWLGIGALAGIAVAAGVSAWLLSTGRVSDLATRLRDTAVEQTAAMGLVIDDVLLEGRVHTPKRAVLRAVGVGRGHPILGLDPRRIARRVSAISWV